MRSAFLVLLLLWPASAAWSQDPAIDLTELDLKALMDIEVEGASLHEQSLKDAPASVTIITQDDIRIFGYRTLAEALSDVRGFFTTYDHMYHFQGVRGFGLPGDYGTRLLLLVNGHNMTDNVLGQSVWFGQDFPLDMNLIKRIEVIRGPASALYGSSGIFATINVVTQPPREFNTIQVRTEIGGFGEKKLQTTTSFAIKNANLLLSASLLRDNGVHDIYVPAYDSPGTNGGHAINVDGEKGYHLFGNVTWRDWNFMALYGGREKGQVISWGQTIFNDSGSRVEDTPNFVDATWTHTFSPSRSLQWRTYYNSYRFRGTFRYPLENGSEENRESFFGDWAGSQLNYRVKVPRLGSLTLGATSQWDLRALQRSFDVTPAYQELLNINKRDMRAAVFAQDELQLARHWKMDVGVRVDYSRLRHNFASPRAALIYQPSPQTSFKLLYGKAFRNPTAYELFFTDLNGQAIGNPDARPEKANTFEFVVEQKVGHRFNALLSAYHYGIDDLLVGEYTVENLLQYQNAARVRASGLEMEVHGQPAHWLELGASVAIQRATKSPDNNVLPNSPGQMTKCRFVVPLLKSPLSLAGSMRYMGTRQTLAGATLPGVFLSDLIVSSKQLTPHLDITAGIRNLGNVGYQDPLALNSRVDTLSAPGRSPFVSLTWR